jgi:hypothetical protein
MWTRIERTGGRTMLRHVVTTVLLLGIAYLAIMALPDVKRYIKIREM